MRAFAGFVIRLIGYALVLGVVARLAEWQWVRNGLDGSIALQQLHDNGMLTLYIAPVVLALIGVGFLRQVAIFLAAFACGAALTAPFIFARVIGA